VHILFLLLLLLLLFFFKFNLIPSYDRYDALRSGADPCGVRVADVIPCLDGRFRGGQVRDFDCGRNAVSKSQLLTLYGCLVSRITFCFHATRMGVPNPRRYTGPYVCRIKTAGLDYQAHGVLLTVACLKRGTRLTAANARAASQWNVLVALGATTRQTVNKRRQSLPPTRPSPPSSQCWNTIRTFWHVVYNVLTGKQTERLPTELITRETKC
jgi:hypothetical protein